MTTFKGIDLNSIKHALDDGAKAIQEGAKTIDVDGAIHKISDVASNGASTASTMVGQFKQAYNGTEEEKAVVIPSSTEAFAKILAHLALSDGDVTQEERTKLADICRELGVSSDGYGDSVIAECSSQVESDQREFGRSSAIKIGAQKVIEGAYLNDQEKKTLCWDMLTVGGADGFDESEVDLIRFVSQKFGVDPVTLQEMKNYYGAAADIEREREQIGNSSRPYNQIDPIANELSDRQLAITDAIRNLIEDN